MLRNKSRIKHLSMLIDLEYPKTTNNKQQMIMQKRTSKKNNEIPRKGETKFASKRKKSQQNRKNSKSSL